MSRFDPDPNAPYGECVTCGITLNTKQDANDHMGATLDQARVRGELLKSHRTRGSNLPRPERIERELDHIVDDAITKAMEEIDDHVARGDFTNEEARQGLRHHASFLEAWEEFTEDSDAEGDDGVRRQILEAVDMVLYVLGLVVEQARTSIQARRDDAERARLLRRAHPNGARGDRR